jgi:exopolyphosphatase / guanosine-5'-triphosphate,3'-diphosphate pyrophosphatase
MPVISAIDVGSNAIRMVIASVEKKESPLVLSRCREPIRLGKDVFVNGLISPGTTILLIDAFKKFRSIIDQHNVHGIRALGTSALRESRNRLEIIQAIAASSGINVTPIGGEEEARIISRAVGAKVNLQNKNSILIDIGGGSVEIIVVENGRVLSTDSLKMGSIRLLEQFGDQKQNTGGFVALVRDHLESARRFIQTKIGKINFDLCVGTGGNIEELGELKSTLLGKSDKGVLSTADLKHLLAQLAASSYEDRITRMKLRPDRADIILPAAVVLEFLLEQFGLAQVMIPHVTFKDGILIELAEEITGTSHIHLWNDFSKAEPPAAAHACFDKPVCS